MTKRLTENSTKKGNYTYSLHISGCGHNSLENNVMVSVSKHSETHSSSSLNYVSHKHFSPLYLWEFTAAVSGRVFPKGEFAPAISGRVLPKREFAPAISGRVLPKGEFTPTVSGRVLPKEEFAPAISGRKLPLYKGKEINNCLIKYRKELL